MTSSDIDKSQIRYARLAGFMYLFVIVGYMLSDFITAGFEVQIRPSTVPVERIGFEREAWCGSLARAFRFNQKLRYSF